MLKASHFSTRTVQNTDNRATLSKVTISKAKKSSPTLQLTSTEYLRGDRGVLSLLLLRNNLQLTSYAASWILPFVLRFQTSLSSNDLETRTHRKIIYSLLRCSLFPSTLQFVFFLSFLGFTPHYIWVMSGSSSSSSRRYWLQLGSPLTVGADGMGRPVWGLTHQHSPLWPWRDILHWNAKWCHLRSSQRPRLCIFMCFFGAKCEAKMCFRPFIVEIRWFLRVLTKINALKMSFLWISRLYLMTKLHFHSCTTMIYDSSPTFSPPHTIRRLHPLLLQPSFSKKAWSHLFEVILPPLVTVGDVQGIQVFQGPSVISEGHLGYPLQDLVELLLTLSLEKRAKNNNSGHVRGARMATSGCVRVTRWVNCPVVILTFVNTKKTKQ